MSLTTDDTTYIVSQTEETTSYENVTFETTTFVSTNTISSNTYTLINTTTLKPPKSLSEGAIAGIITGSILGILVLLIVGYFVYKYRKYFADILRKTPRETNIRSVRYKSDNSPTNINFSSTHDYLTAKSLS